MAEPPSVAINPVKYFQGLEKFDGDYNDLFTFIRLVDRLYPFILTYNQVSQSILTDLIKSRLTGRAREVIEINCQAESWPEIKEILLNNFGERKDCEELFDELRGITFKTNSIDFYNEVKSKLRNLNNKTIIILGSNTAATRTCVNNMRTALNIFKAKIPEPMKTILTCRNPETLEGAMNILFEAGYADLTVNGFSNKNRSQNNSRNNDGKSNGFFSKNKFNDVQNYPVNRNNNTNYFNQNHSHYNRNFSQNHRNQNSSQNNYNNSLPFRQQNSVQNNYNGYYQNRTRNPQPNRSYDNRQQSNTPNLYPNMNTGVFSRPNNGPLPAPEPMDVNHHVATMPSANMSSEENFHSPASIPNYHI